MVRICDNETNHVTDLKCNRGQQGVNLDDKAKTLRYRSMFSIDKFSLYL